MIRLRLNQKEILTNMLSQRSNNNRDTKCRKNLESKILASLVMHQMHKSVATTPHLRLPEYSGHVATEPTRLDWLLAASASPPLPVVCCLLCFMSFLRVSLLHYQKCNHLQSILSLQVGLGTRVFFQHSILPYTAQGMQSNIKYMM